MGWTPSLTGSATGSLITDTVDGQPAAVWYANGTNGRATWDWIPSETLVTRVAQNGWRIESRVRVLDGTYVTDYYADGSRRFLPILSRQANGDLTVQLEAGGFHVLAAGSAADDYHRHSVWFNPLTQTATYSFDGVPIETWAGSTTAQRQITFGQGSTPSDGQAYYRSMVFQPAPEPGVATALATGVVMLGGVSRNRRRRRA
jgi:sialidase-1